MQTRKSLFHISKLFIFCCSFIFGISYLNGCNNDDNPVNPAASTYLMIVHASPDAPNVDIVVGGTTVATDVQYLSNTTYQAFTPGNNRVRIYPTGTTTALIDTTIFLQQDMYYSVYASDSLQNIFPLVTADNLSSPGSTNSSIRFIHLSPNTPTLDAGAVQKTTPWFPFYTFGQVANFRAVTAGTYDLEMNLAGTTQQVALLPSRSLEQGGIYTMVAVGFNGASGFQALSIKLIKNK